VAGDSLRVGLFVGLLGVCAALSASSVINIITHEELLQTVLPEEGQVTRHEYQVGEAILNWVERHFHFRPQAMPVEVWLARDPASNKILVV